MERKTHTKTDKFRKQPTTHFIRKKVLAQLDFRKEKEISEITYMINKSTLGLIKKNGTNFYKG